MIEVRNLKSKGFNWYLLNENFLFKVVRYRKHSNALIIACLKYIMKLDLARNPIHLKSFKSHYKKYRQNSQPGYYDTLGWVP